MNDELSLRKELAEVTHEVYRKGYTPPLNGNMSVRLDDGHILITPSYVCKGLVTEDSVLKIGMDGQVIGSLAKPSIETGMHLAIYRQRPDVRGIVHAHPRNISVFAVANKPIDVSIMPEAVYLLGAVKCIDYFMPGSDELREAVARHAAEYDAYLLFNHGMITVGRDIREALYRLETLELCAELELKAKTLGGAVGLSGPEIDKLLEVRKTLREC
jgi:L-fuculose-phosphate aldolase